MSRKDALRFTANYFLALWLLLLALDFIATWDFAGMSANPKSEKACFAVILIVQAILLEALINDIAKPPLNGYRNIVRHLKEGRRLMLMSSLIFGIWLILLLLGIVSPPTSPASTWINRLILLAVATLPTAAWYSQFNIERGEDSLTVNLRWRAVQQEYGLSVGFVYAWWAVLTPLIVAVFVGLRFFLRH